jgi:hypothetical protein
MFFCRLKNIFGLVWWYIPMIPALGRQRQEGLKFQNGLEYTARPCLKKQKMNLKELFCPNLG